MIGGDASIAEEFFGVCSGVLDFDHRKECGGRSACECYVHKLEVSIGAEVGGVIRLEDSRTPRCYIECWNQDVLPLRLETIERLVAKFFNESLFELLVGVSGSENASIPYPSNWPLKTCSPRVS